MKTLQILACGPDPMPPLALSHVNDMYRSIQDPLQSTFVHHVFAMPSCFQLLIPSGFAPGFPGSNAEDWGSRRCFAKALGGTVITIKAGEAFAGMQQSPLGRPLIYMMI